MTSFNEVKNEWLKDPRVLLSYMSSSSGTKISAESLRTLFNQAARPVPKELQETKEEYFQISRSALASLVYTAAKHNGYGPVSRAALWLKTRFSY